MNKEKIDNIINKLRVGPYFAPSVTYGVLSGLFLAIILLSMNGCVARAQKNVTYAPIYKPIPADTVKKHYTKYLEDNKDSQFCLSPAEFLRILQEIERRAAVDSVIEARVRKIDSTKPRKMYIYSWPGATRNINSIWR